MINEEKLKDKKYKQPLSKNKTKKPNKNFCKNYFFHSMEKLMPLNMDIEKIKISDNHSNNGKTSERYTSQEEQPLSTSTEIKNLNPIQEELNTNDDNIYYYTANDIENNSDNQNSENYDDNEKINLNFNINNPNIIHKNIFMNYKQKNSISKNKKNGK